MRPTTKQDKLQDCKVYKWVQQCCPNLFTVFGRRMLVSDVFIRFFNFCVKMVMRPFEELVFCINWKMTNKSKVHYLQMFCCFVCWSKCLQNIDDVDKRASIDPSETNAHKKEICIHSIQQSNWVKSMISRQHWCLGYIIHTDRGCISWNPKQLLLLS